MKIQLLLTAFMVALASQGASAEEPHFYLGGGVGTATVGFNSGDFAAQTPNAINSTETRDTGYKIFGGYNFNENWAVEAGYANLGRFAYKWYAPGAPGSGLYNQNVYVFDYRAGALFAVAKGALPVTGQLGVFGKLGVTVNKAQDTFTLDSSRHIEPPLAPCFTCRERHVGFAGAASQNDRCSLGKTVGSFIIPAFRADKTVRPSQMFKVSCAGGIIWESPLKFGKRCRKATRVHSENLAAVLVIGKQPDRQSLSNMSIRVGIARLRPTQKLASSTS